jgi:hypothetical protein
MRKQALDTTGHLWPNADEQTRNSLRLIRALRIGLPWLPCLA